MKKLIFILSLIILVFSSKYLEEKEKKLINYNYRGRNGLSQNTVLFRISGMKKFGTAIYWIKQTIRMGEMERGKEFEEELFKRSEKITFLNPYFLGNYYSAGSTLGFIRLFNRLDLALEIYRRGLEYNPNDEGLSMYMGAVLAKSKGNDEELLKIYEAIVKNRRDDNLILILAYTYEQKYLEDLKEINLKKGIYYWELLSKSKDNKYKQIAKRRLEALLTKN